MKKALKILGIAILLLLSAGLLVYLNSAAVIRWVLELPPYESERREGETVAVQMRDGTSLETHIFKPEGQGPWPVVLIRDPYSANSITCKLLARYNYACVHQDTRGRFGSEGQWYPVINERNDGLDTLDWLVSQPWQNGYIATMGGSYVGLVQWAMIDALPAEVKTVVADVSHGDWYAIMNRGGHFAQGVATAWALGFYNPDVSLQEMAERRPMVEASADILGEEGSWYTDYVQNPAKSSDYWQSTVYKRVRDAHLHSTIPVLMTAGWHDFFVGGQLKVFEALPRRADSLLAIRNGGHGPTSVGGAIDSVGFAMRLTLAWLGKHLKSDGVSDLIAPGYLLQSNTTGKYQHFDSWPQANSQVTYQLDALQQSTACDGGNLALEKTQPRESVSYVYDPLQPVPSLGGSYQFGESVVEQGSENCARQDVLSFESPVFDTPETILGAIKIQLQVASDAADSAFTVKLQEKFADGRVLNIRDDITSLSFRNGASSRAEYQAGASVELVFDLTPIKWTLSAGSSLRLDVSSSNFPFYNAHPNTVNHWFASTETKKATQTLFAGKLVIPLE